MQDALPASAHHPLVALQVGRAPLLRACERAHLGARRDAVAVARKAVEAFAQRREAPVCRHRFANRLACFRH
eukprot:842581-Pleurochrysis_carterae.AAC.2